MPVLPALAVTALLLGAPASAADTPADPPAGTVEQLIEQLRDDPVLVQPSMGMGDSELAHDVLTSAAAGLDLPAYVVLAEVPDDVAGAEYPSEAAAALMQAELGDGLYHVEFRGEISHTQAWGDEELADAGTAPVTFAMERAESNAHGDYPRVSAVFEAVLTLRWAAAPLDELPDDVVDDYAAQPWAFLPESDYYRADANAGRWVALLATVTGVLVAGTIITLVAARARRRDATLSAPARRVGPLPAGRGMPTSTSAVPDDIAVTAQGRLDDVRRRLARLPAAQVSGVHGEAAATAIEAGDRVLATGDPLDAVGAVVLAEVAGRELDRAGSQKRRPYHPCFVNPLHGEARDTVRLDGSSIDAPVCRACARVAGPMLAVRRRLRGRVPYVDTSTVWARTGYGALVSDLAAQVLEDRSTRR
ncbi:hypothetical protein E1212_04240 [Jiangella ureilytica]|uniref:Uncharacterized protein n=1 Tax=Jiangella ureilytica TaxID=2530374 RepID=A0A4R4RVA8_9ACTN|nr:hypothetical protein [Jiangella ureilytica]TDC54000.1 hypothetical protein E1212_04240 [Jiangella ureilytica]